MDNNLSGIRINKNILVEYVDSQLQHFFPDNPNTKTDLKKHIDAALVRMYYSLKQVKLKGYTEFSYLHSDLYAQFIYFLSNTIWTESGNTSLASKLFYLNKVLHGINCMYDTKLPDIFILIHCVGTVLGKAEYSNYFVACQNVTVGSDKGFSPIMSEGVYMGPGSSIIGNCKIGKYTHIGINALLRDQDSTEESLIIGSSPDLIPKKLKRNLIKEIYFYSESKQFI
jgi:serine O-acetyltransferase